MQRITFSFKVRAVLKSFELTTRISESTVHKAKNLSTNTRRILNEEKIFADEYSTKKKIFADEYSTKKKIFADEYSTKKKISPTNTQRRKILRQRILDEEFLI